MWKSFKIHKSVSKKKCLKIFKFRMKKCVKCLGKKGKKFNFEHQIILLDRNFLLRESDNEPNLGAQLTNHIPLLFFLNCFQVHQWSIQMDNLHIQRFMHNQHSDLLVIIQIMVNRTLVTHRYRHNFQVTLHPCWAIHNLDNSSTIRQWPMVQQSILDHRPSIHN